MKPFPWATVIIGGIAVPTLGLVLAAISMNIEATYF